MGKVRRGRINFQREDCEVDHVSRDIVNYVF